MKIPALLFAASVLGPMVLFACATGVEGPQGSGGEGGEDTWSVGSSTSTSTTTTTGTSTTTSTSTASGTGGNNACGNGTIDPGETCDPPSTCPTSCADADSCTDDTTQGSPATCNVACVHTAITACKPDGCCPASCTQATDPDCAGCGNGVVDPGEACDDGNADNTDACLTNCVAASCGDGFVHAGVEACDDGNTVNGDGCSNLCTTGAQSFGPVHTFVNMSSTFYVTQFGCSNSGGDPAGDALWFCQHFYSAGCTAEPVWMETQNSVNPMMHSGTNCNDPDPSGVSIPNTVCIGGPCKIGDYQGPVGGLTNLICDCP